MRVRWTSEAEGDRDCIWQSLSRANPAAAVHIDQQFTDAASKLAEFPQLEHAGAIVGTRELLAHPRYRFVNEIVDDTIWIHALVHTARRWPPA